jgi:hypothetical protein
VSARPLDAETLAELDAIDRTRDDAFAALREANRDGLTARDLDAVIAAFDGVERRLEALHRKVWPRHRGRLILALGDALLVSPTGRSTRLVWRRDWFGQR